MRGLDVIGQVAVSLAVVCLALTALVIADRRARRTGRKPRANRGPRDARDRAAAPNRRDSGGRL